MLLPLQASGSGDELLLESLLLQGVLWDDEVLRSEAILLFGRREVITVLRILGVLGATLVLVPFRGVMALLGGVVAELDKMAVTFAYDLG